MIFQKIIDNIRRIRTVVVKICLFKFSFPLNNFSNKKNWDLIYERYLFRNMKRSKIRKRVFHTRCGGSGDGGYKSWNKWTRFVYIAIAVQRFPVKQVGGSKCALPNSNRVEHSRDISERHARTARAVSPIATIQPFMHMCDALADDQHRWSCWMCWRGMRDAERLER